MTTSLLQTRWQELAAQHRDEISGWTQPFRIRRRKGISHPIDDFLFVYYRYSTRKLERWHPGVGVSLKGGALAKGLFVANYYRYDGHDAVCDSSKIPDKSCERMRWIADLLRRTQLNRPNFSCLGLHEWAMVYRGQEVRHEKTTRLRLAQAEIDQLVESRPLTCSHFDAFRFFANDAKPLNRVLPTLDSRPEFEQPACIHANMDLYKWAFKSMPWIGSELLRNCFYLALEARAIDMRASPYDLSEYSDYPPIKIETAAGRIEYEQLQREIAEKAKPLRQKLIDRLEEVLA